jgi:diaminopimelate decarboxylase
LNIGGVDLMQLVEEVGTPVFVYDEDHLRDRCREAVAGFGTGVAYATKAFLCKAMAALAIEENMALDVSTGGEMAVALAGLDVRREANSSCSMATTSPPRSS